jgi:hypothetical protein
MGTSRSSAELAGKFNQAAKVITEGEAEGNKAVAEFLKVTTLGLAAGPTGGDLKFSGNPKGVIGVRTTPEGKAVKVKATGPMHWLESGVKRHGIAPKGVGGSRASRTAAAASIGKGQHTTFGKLKAGKSGVLRYKDGTFSRYSRAAGGLPARGTWSKGIAIAEQRQGEIQRLHTVKRLSSVF